MKNFKPTWLYVKQHLVTGLKYFGKTTAVDPYTYAGSGIYWKNHLREHGSTVTTLWCRLFTDEQELIKYATEFSKNNNIVESSNWANLKMENGLDGAPIGNSLSQQTREKISAGNKGKLVTDITRQKMRNRIISEETKQKISDSLTGRTRGPISEETRQKMKEAHKMVTRVISDESRKRKSEIMRNYRHSDEVRERMSKPKGPMKKLTCNCCGRIGGANYINRSHNDKCIEKNKISHK